VRVPLSQARLRTSSAAATDLGRRRSGNEDCFKLWEAEPSAAGHAADTLLVVCDGMGGSNAGEVASHMAAETVVREFSASAADDAVAALTHAIEVANTEIWDMSRTRSDLNGMGTTCTAVALKGGEVRVAHVGDSRAYLVRAHRATQLTTDHSLVAQLVARNQLSPEEARHDPRRNVVTRSVGVGPEVEVDIVSLSEPLQGGDTLVICSDGLHGQVSDDEIAGSAMGESLDEACRSLIELANERGGPDNITVVMLRVSGTGARPGNPLVRWWRTIVGRRDRAGAPARASARPAAEGGSGSETRSGSGD
jgi:protein phosphatase